MSEKQIKRFYRIGLFLGSFIPIIFILAVSLGPRDMNLYYAIIYFGLIPSLISFCGSIIWVIFFLIKWLSDKTIHIKNFKLPFILNLIIVCGIGFITFFSFVLPFAMLD
ncbi:MAG: hypothetical protein RR585_04830 [Coprobacillus sp.]